MARDMPTTRKGGDLLKKTIEYEDFNGDIVVEDHYFHLTKADLIEMEMSHRGGLHEYLQKIVADEDGSTIIAEFKNLILMAYGKRSEDGKRFIKTQQMRDEFLSSEAYSQLFMELCTNATAAAEFVNGIVPAGLDADMAKLAAPSMPIPTDSQILESMQPRVLSLQEATEMEADELKSGLATGRYKLS
jgi:hypothetical protein